MSLTWLGPVRGGVHQNGKNKIFFFIPLVFSLLIHHSLIVKLLEIYNQHRWVELASKYQATLVLAYYVTTFFPPAGEGYVGEISMAVLGERCR